MQLSITVFIVDPIFAWNLLQLYLFLFYDYLITASHCPLHLITIWQSDENRILSNTKDVIFTLSNIASDGRFVYSRFVQTMSQQNCTMMYRRNAAGKAVVLLCH